MHNSLAPAFAHICTCVFLRICTGASGGYMSWRSPTCRGYQRLCRRVHAYVVGADYYVVGADYYVVGDFTPWVKFKSSLTENS